MKRSKSKYGNQHDVTGEEHGCTCKNTEESVILANEPTEFAVKMPETLDEYMNNHSLKKYFFDTFITNCWVKRVQNTIPFVCKCCKAVHSQLYKKVIMHVLKGGELPSEVVQEEGAGGGGAGIDNKILSCLFCQCTTVSCPIQKRALDIDKIRENSRIVSQALTAPTYCSPRSDAAMVDLSNKYGLVPFTKNTIFDKLENVGLATENFHLKYLLDDSSLSVSDAACDVSTKSSNEQVIQANKAKLNTGYCPQGGNNIKVTMYLVGARELAKPKTVMMGKTENVNEDDYSMADDELPVKYRSLLTDNQLYGKDPCLCEKCYKRVEFNNYIFIFRRTVKKWKTPLGALLCTCELDPYDVLEAEVKEESECERENKNIRKCEFDVLMNNVITNWNKYVDSRRNGIIEPMDDLTVMAIEDLARFFCSVRPGEGLISPSISQSEVSSQSKPSSTESVIICKIGVIANKLYKRFPPCQVMLEELEDICLVADEEGGDATDKIKSYAQELKIKMMPQKISLKKNSGKKNVYCDTHEKEELVGLIKYQADKMIKENSPEEEAVPEDEETVISKPSKCHDSLVGTESDEENVDRLTELVTALQKKDPNRQDDENSKPQKPCTCGMPPLNKTTSDDNCKQWIQENWDDGDLIDRLEDDEEILVEFLAKEELEKESDLEDNYSRLVSTFRGSKQEATKQDKTGKDKKDASKQKEKEKEKEKAKKQKEKDKKDKKGDEGRPSKRRKKSRRIRETVSPSKMEAHSLDYRQMVEYLHSRKNVSFKDITRLYKYPVLRLPAPQWRLRNKLLMRLRNRKIMMSDGKGHRMQIFILPRETWQGKVLSRPFISYGLFKRRIMPFRQKYPRWIKPTNIKKFKKRNVINKEALKNLIFPPTEDKGKKDGKKDKKDKKKFCRSIRHKDRSMENVVPLFAHNYNVNYYCKEVNDKSNQSFIDKRRLEKKKGNTAVEERVERDNNKNELNESNKNFTSRKYLQKKKGNRAEEERVERNNNKNELNESNQLFINEIYSAMKRAKVARDEWDIEENVCNERNQWFVQERYTANKKKKHSAMDEWEKHKNCEKYVVNLVKIPPDVVVKRKYLFKKIMVDAHRKLIVVELKRGEKHHSQSIVRYFIPFIVVSKTRLPVKRKKTDHPNHVAYLIRNALLKQIKTRFRLPPMKLIMRKLVELAETLFKFTMGYRAHNAAVMKLKGKKFELLGFTNLEKKSFEDIALAGFNVVMYWLLFKLKLYTMYNLLRSERFDLIMRPMVAQPRTIPENSSEYLEELNCIRFEIECQTLLEIQNYGLENKGVNIKNCKNPSMAKVLDKCKQCGEAVSEVVAERRALKLFNAMVSLVKHLYDYDPPSVDSIKSFKLPELIGSDEELYNAAEDDSDEGKVQVQQEVAPQKGQVQQKPVAQQQEKKVGPAAEPGKGETERSGKDTGMKIKKWMNYDFESNIYFNQRSLTLEGLIEYIKAGGEGDTILRKKSIDLEHIIPGLVGITLEGFLEIENEKNKGKKKGGKKFLRARSKKSCSCIRRDDQRRPTFQKLLVKQLYGLPDLPKLNQISKSRKSLKKVKIKRIPFGKPKLMIVPSKKPKLILIKESNSEPIVIVKGELNIAGNIDKTEFRNICTPVLNMLNTPTINNLLNKISSQNLVKNKLMQFISVVKHKKKLKPSFSDPVLYKKCNPIIIHELQDISNERSELKRTCSEDQSLSIEQNKALSYLVNLITDHLEEILTIEVLNRQTRKLNSESALIKPKLPLIKKISVEKLIKKKLKRKIVKKVASKKAKLVIRAYQTKTSKSKIKVKDTAVTEGSRRGKKVKTQIGSIDKNIAVNTGKERDLPDTQEILPKRSKNKKDNIISKTVKNPVFPGIILKEVTSKANKNQIRRSTADTRKSVKKKFESIIKKNKEQKLTFQKAQETVITYQSELSLIKTDHSTENQDREHYKFQSRKYCKCDRRKYHISNSTNDNTKQDPMKKISADTILSYLKNRLAEIPEKEFKIREPSCTRGYLSVSSGENEIINKIEDDKDKKVTSDSHDKSAKKKSDFEINTSMKKKRYSSSSIRSIDERTNSASTSRKSHKKHKHNEN